MNLTKRKGFNFFRSYYDVYNMLSNNKDKNEFVEAIFNKQFFGIDPDLDKMSDMVKMAYISQKHSLDKSVKGFEDKTGINLQVPLEHSFEGNPIPLERSFEQLQVEVELEEKLEKKKNIPTYEDFKTYGLEKKPNVSTEGLKLKYESWIENGWKNGNDKPIKNWKTNLLNTLQYIPEVKSKKWVSPG